MPEAQPAASTVLGISRGEEAFITPGHVWAWVTEKPWLIQVSGVWVRGSSMSVYVHQHTGVVRAPPSMLTQQQAHFQVAAPHNQGKYDLQLKSKGECLKGCGFRIYMRCKSKSSFILLALSHFLADTVCVTGIIARSCCLGYKKYTKTPFLKHWSILRFCWVNMSSFRLMERENS